MAFLRSTRFITFASLWTARVDAVLRRREQSSRSSSLGPATLRTVHVAAVARYLTVSMVFSITFAIACVILSVVTAVLLLLHVVVAVERTHVTRQARSVDPAKRSAPTSRGRL
jgi:hypothetical protein